jgi:putative ABC transport system ATP-binding protein
MTADRTGLLPEAADGFDEIVVELSGVTKSFPTPAGPRQQVLDGVDLSVELGEIVAVAGRSGSGKTTLLTIVAGWEQPDAGSLTVLGNDVRPDRRSWSDVAILPQSLGLLDELTVAENIALPLRLGTVPDAADPGDLMARLGIDHLGDRYPSETSLGEQQRTALARAAVVGPRLLLADEPIAHQNRTWAEGMLLLLDNLAVNGTTCLLATHDELAFDAAHRVLELRAGRLEPAAR